MTATGTHSHVPSSARTRCAGTVSENGVPVTPRCTPSIVTVPDSAAPVAASVAVTVTITGRRNGTGEGATLVDIVCNTGATTIGMSAVKSPNQVTSSWTMRHWKAYVPGAVGAVIGKLNVTSSPGATSRGTSTRLSPQVELSCGSWAPSRNGFEP